MSSREEMIAHGRSVEQVASELGADSLHYLSLEGVYEAIGGTRENHCDACFTGEYPLAGTEGANGKFAFEAARASVQLPLHAMNGLQGGLPGRPSQPATPVRVPE